MSDEYQDEELEKMFADQGQAAGGGDEEWDVDWSPQAGLLEIGEHDGILADVSRGETSGFGGKPKKPAIIWAVTDTGTGRTLAKAVPTRDGGGIERLNIDFARAFGVEPTEKPSGGWSLPGTQLRAHVGEKCRFVVEHWSDSEGNLRDSLAKVLPPVLGIDEQLTLPDES